MRSSSPFEELQPPSGPAPLTPPQQLLLSRLSSISFTPKEEKEISDVMLHSFKDDLTMLSSLKNESDKYGLSNRWVEKFVVKISEILANKKPQIELNTDMRECLINELKSNTDLQNTYEKKTVAPAIEI